jgi:GNAT superfamily N-acetyltransferase
MTKADIPAGMRLKELAGWNQTTGDWERFLEASPQGCFVAESKGAIRGTVTTIIYEARFAWVGMVLVDPEHRGQGLGTQLLNMAIEHLDSVGIPSIKLDATPKGKPIYEKLGFVSEYEIERWALNRRDRAPKLETTSSLQVGKSENFEEILRIDREAFGADRSALLRSLDHSSPEFTATVFHQGLLTGYSLGRSGSRADQMGPWVARNETAARQLLLNFLSHSNRELIFVDCMKASPLATLLLKSAGFEFSRPLMRMYRGANGYSGHPGLFCGILGPEFG